MEISSQIKAKIEEGSSSNGAGQEEEKQVEWGPRGRKFLSKKNG